MALDLIKPSANYEELTPSEFKSAFDEFYKSIRNFIYYKCSEADVAEDVAQDVFVKLWETRLHIDKRTLRAYLYTIAHNLLVNHYKRKTLHYNFQKRPYADRDFDTPEKETEMKQYEEQLNLILSELPAGGREVFLMNRLEDLTYQEIATRLGLSVKAIEKRMTKVLKILRVKLGREI